MPLNKLLRDGDNEDLAEERRKATFDTDEMAAIIWEGKERVRRRREITKKVNEYTELHDPFCQAFMTRHEEVENAARKITKMFSLIDKLGVNPTNAADMAHLTSEVIGLYGHPLALHAVMFIPSLQAQCADDQMHWLKKAMSRQIIGTYAQTELGHGTNLRKLETTATYDAKTQEFILHSPTRTAMKWWPGNLGKSANHAVVVACLIIDGKNYGPHNFIVPLRDPETHMPLKGITVGDIGPKMATGPVDNGFLSFDHYRIPRTNMLMKHAKVTPEGKYVPPAHAKVGYSAMVHVRSHMISDQAKFLAQALTTAIRYSAIRRQGEIQPGDGEVKILEYQTQQYRLLPQLARAYAFSFTGRAVRDLYLRVQKDVAKGKVDEMAELHYITSGLKAVVTHLTGEGISQARMSCGGHGYSKASNMPDLYGIAVAGCTYEGENMVMLQQLARYLMRAAGEAEKGRALGRLVNYLVEPSDIHSSIDRQPDYDYKAHLKAFDKAAKLQVMKAFERMRSLRFQGLSDEDAWNANAVELNRAARVHTRQYIARQFYQQVNAVVDGRCREVLRDLLHLHLNYELLDMAYYLLEDGFLSGQQMDYMKEDMYRLLAKLRPNAVSLVDSWDISDHELRSVLGRRDGHVYENLYKWAQESELNRTQVLPTFEKYLKPMMMEAHAQSKL
nr:Acyl-CoA oxidase dehydrogenase and Acyl-CoA oxidase domain containing protein [Haemonchus contortus]